MNRLLALVITAGLTLGLAGCGTPRITTDFDHDADFGAIATYAWQDSDLTNVEESGLDPVVIDRTIRDAVDERLAAKGLRLVTDDAAADAWVVYHASVERKVQVSTIQTPSMSRSTTRWTYNPLPPSSYRGTGDMYEYDAGTLLLYLIDPATEKPIWRGLSEGVVSPSRSVEERQASIDEAVAAMLAKFPPR